jgi:hypothetical protein
MDVNFELNFWDSLFAVLGISIGSFVAVWIHRLSKRLTATDKYQHELRVTEEIQKIGFDKDVILADISKYHPLRDDGTNKTYYKQGAGLFTVIPEYGVQFILTASDKRIPIGLVPFEWIQYVRDHDSEDNKFIIVCKFKGVRWYKNFKSPFKEIRYLFKNPHYDKNSDPSFMKFMIEELESK